MSLWRLALRGVRFYWRTNLAVWLAVVVATGVLTGALAVGDSVRYTLQKNLEARLREVQFAVLPQGRFFRAALADDLEQRLGGTVAPVLQVSGIITNEDGSQRINRVQVLGVTDKFYAAASAQSPFGKGTVEGIVLSDVVARKLAVAAGEEVVLRVEKPGLMPREVPLASDKDRTVAFRLPVQAVADDAAFGRFDLQANQAAALNVFVPLSWLGRQIDQPDRANLLLAAHLKSDLSDSEVSRALEKVWRPADAGLEIEPLTDRKTLELRSRRIFLDEPIGTAAVKADATDSTEGVLAYFVNEIRLGDKATPYSMVAALDDPRLLPANMGADGIVINQWLADDLGARIGDSLDLAYFILGPRRQLLEQQSRFKVAKIIPMDDPACDPSLMPAYPGLADANNCRDWKPGVPVDLDKIRPKDEQYWNKYRGTPKAFVTLAAGQKMWSNRYGNLTAVRYPWREGLGQELEQRLRSKIDPAAVGLFFQPVRQRGVAASRHGTDFGQLFLGLSMFLIASAVILTGLLFVFGVENRRGQVGMLMAVGWPARRVRMLLLAEGGLVAFLGTAVGVGVGVLYTRLMVHALGTLWSGAIAGAIIYYHVRNATFLWGGLSGLVAALFAIWLTLRKQATQSARALMTGEAEETWRHGGRSARSDAARRLGRGSLGRIVLKISRLGYLGGTPATHSECPGGHTAGGHRGIVVAVLALLGVAVILLIIPAGGGEAAAGAFFGAGALLLIGTLGLSHAALRRAAGVWNLPLASLRGLGLRNAARRSGRSLAIIGLLACGAFLVVAVGANRHDPLKETHGRDSGTGGFAFYGDSSIPILHDLSAASGRKALGLAGPGLDDLQAVQFRIRDGDDASCLNLNRAQQPRLMGVSPEALSQRNAFRFTAMIDRGREEEGWGLLRMSLEQGVVPAIGDYPTVFWGLGKNIGDELEYIDETGRPFRVRIVGMLANSVLQGSLVIAENEFVARFPSVDGYRVFLIDAPPERAGAIAQELSSGLRDYGLVLIPTAERLAAFGAVENTYLSIFTALGGLGLVLGSVGLGLVVLRNMLERRGELAMLRAVGFSRGRLQRMVFYEHWGLLLAGLACGVISALVAVLPAAHTPGGEVPYLTLLVTIVCIALSGAVWVWLAAILALRGPLLEALRHE